MNLSRRLVLLLSVVCTLSCDVVLIEANHPLGPIARDDVDLLVPVSSNPDDPFFNPAFRAGVLAWRRPNFRGACVHCHTFDGSDLARLDFSDAVVRARARAEGASDADGNAIAAWIKLQRQRLGISTPLNPVKFRLIPGDPRIDTASSTHEKEDVLFAELEARGLLLVSTAGITTVEQAMAARDELLDLDLRLLPTAIVFPRVSESPSNGENFVRINELVPSFASVVAPAAARQVFAHQNAYIRDSSPSHLWKAVEGAAAASTVRSLESIPSSVAVQARRQYIAFQVVGYMLNRGEFVYPDPGAGLANPRDQDREAYFARLQIFGLAADAAANATTDTWNGLPQWYKAEVCPGSECAFGDGRIDADPGSPHPGQAHMGWWWDLAGYRRGMGWLHGMVDPSGRASQYLERIRRENLTAYGQRETLSIHRALSDVLRFVHFRFGSDTRFFPATVLDSISAYALDKSEYCKAGTFSWWELVADRGVSVDATPRAEKLRRLTANSLRMEILLRIAYLETGGRLSDRIRWERCLEVLPESFAHLEPESRAADTNAMLDRLRLAVAAADEGSDPVNLTDQPRFLPPMFAVPLPLR